MNPFASKTSMVILSIFFVLFMHVHVESAQRVSIAMPMFPPYVHVSDEKPGFIPEIIMAAFESQGYEVSFHRMSFARALAAVRVGEYDAIAPIYRTIEREDFLFFSESIGKSRIFLLNNKDRDVVFTSLFDLKNYRIGVIRGATITPDFDHATYLIKEEVKEQVQNIRKLMAGRIDLVVANELVLMWTIDQLCREFNQCSEYIWKEFAIHTTNIGFSKVNHNHIEYSKAFNIGFRIIKENNIYNEILRKYNIIYQDGILQSVF